MLPSLPMFKLQQAIEKHFDAVVLLWFVDGL
jgi:hypothetical protein